ncbi:MAG: ribosome biogenesis GTPase Der [bacterium]
MNIVAIVGRPNVGKSTLFNRLIGEKSAIIEATPGVTRDRLYGESDWNGKYFMVIDTGGFIPGTEDTMEKAIREQAYIAIEEADAIIFVCDGKDGVTPFDIDIATILRTSNKPVTLVINKCDNEKMDLLSYEFHNLGLGNPYPISGLNGRGTGDFLDEVAQNLKDESIYQSDARLKIAFVGRPNSGKSSLTNALLGQERSIVTDIPGTTRDSIDSVLKFHGEEIVLIDTAGLRKKSRIKENIEMFSILRTATAISRSDVVVVLVDAQRGFEEQDKKIINQVTDARKGVIIALNKWDIVEKDNKTAQQYEVLFYEQMQTHYYAPIVFISALTKQRIVKVIEIAKEIKDKRCNRVSTANLNKTILPILERTPPPAVHGRDLRINYITQTGIEPPVFAFFCNYPQLIPDSYKKFMEKSIRANFNFEGTPISFIFRKKNKNDFFNG